MKRRKGLTVLFTALFLLFAGAGLYGCAQKPSPSKPAKKTAPSPTMPVPPAATASGIKTAPVFKASKKAGSKNLEAAAMKIINAYGCLGCHAINGKGGSSGPNLSKEGMNGHSVHWLEVQIDTPKVHDFNTMMPRHSLNPAQLKTVAEYLESLK